MSKEEFTYKLIRLFLDQSRLSEISNRDSFSNGQILSSQEYLNKKIKDFDLYAKDFPQTKKN